MKAIIYYDDTNQDSPVWRCLSASGEPITLPSAFCQPHDLLNVLADAAAMADCDVAEILVARDATEAQAAIVEVANVKSDC